MRQIGIIGGGASGMMAAIAAANTSIKDTEITILERRDPGLAARYWRPETESATSAILIFLRSGITEATTRTGCRSSLRVSRHPIRSAFLRNEVFI